MPCIGPAPTLRQVRFAPRNIASFAGDVAASKYFQRQLHRQFMTAFTEVVDDGKFDTAMALVSLEVRCCVANTTCDGRGLQFVRKCKSALSRSGQPEPQTVRPTLFNDLQCVAFPRYEIEKCCVFAPALIVRCQTHGALHQRRAHPAAAPAFRRLSSMLCGRSTQQCRL